MNAINSIYLGAAAILMGCASLHADGEENALIKSQGLKSFDQLRRDGADGVIRMLWLRGEKGAIVIDVDLVKRLSEKITILKSGADKQRRALTESDVSILNFMCGYVELEKLPAEDPHDSGVDGNSICIEIHQAGFHRSFQRWMPFQSYKLPKPAVETADPFAAGSKPSLPLQRKSTGEEGLTALAILILQVGDAGTLLPRSLKKNSQSKADSLVPQKK